MSDHIVLRLDRQNDVIDLLDLAAMLSGIGAQFDDFLKERYPEVHGHAQMGVRELREGSIVAHLAGVIAPHAIAIMDHSLIMYQFLQLLKGRVERLGGGTFLESASKRDLQSVTDMVTAIANDAGAEANFDFKEFDGDGQLRKQLTVSVNTKQAKQIIQTAGTPERRDGRNGSCRS